MVCQDLAKGCLTYYIDALRRLVVTGVLRLAPNGAQCLHIWLLRFLIRHLIEADVEGYISYYNLHRVRYSMDADADPYWCAHTVHACVLSHPHRNVGQPSVLFRNPEVHGKTNRGRAIDADKLQLLKERFPAPAISWYPAHYGPVFSGVLRLRGLASTAEVTKLNWIRVVKECVLVLDALGVD